MPRSAREISSALESKGFERRESNLVECPLSQEEYVQILRAGAHIGQEAAEAPADAAPPCVRRLQPLAERLHVDFGPDPAFESTRAVQVRLHAFDHARLLDVGRRVRDLSSPMRPAVWP